MTSVAVVAHARQGARRRAGGAAQRADPRRRRRPALVRGAEEQARRSACARPSTRAPTCCSCGAATAWCNGASTPSAPSRSRSRSSRRVRATCSPATSAIPHRPRAGGRGRAARGAAHDRRRPGQRRAVRGDGGHRARRADDPRRRPRAQGPVRARRVRVDRGQAPPDASRSAPASRSTARRGSTGKAGCILVGNVGKVLGGVEAFDDASPEDGLLELGVITAKGVTQWTRTLVRTAVGERRPLEVRADDQGARRSGQARPQDALRARRR